MVVLIILNSGNFENYELIPLGFKRSLKFTKSCNSIIEANIYLMHFQFVVNKTWGLLYFHFNKTAILENSCESF